MSGFIFRFWSKAENKNRKSAARNLLKCGPFPAAFDTVQNFGGRRLNLSASFIQAAPASELFFAKFTTP
jgi:hypothetical protein